MANLTRYKAKYILNCAMQLVRRPDIALLGAYDYSNVGDVALGQALDRTIKSLVPGVKTGIRTLHNFHVFPKSDSIIIGGGAVVSCDRIANFIKRGVSPNAVSLVGCEIDRKSGRFKVGEVKFLKEVAFLGLRNSAQRGEAFGEYSIRDIAVHPDIVFSMYNEVPINKHAESRRIGINVVNGCGRDGARTARGDSEIRRVMVEYFRSVANEYIVSGYDVVHLPFAHKDQVAARRIFNGLAVDCREYDFDPVRVMREVASCDLFFSSRYHSLIFSLITQTPVVPFFYARKNYWLRDDFFPDLPGFGFREISEPGFRLDGRLRVAPYVAGSDALLKLKENADAAIANAVRPLI